MVLAGLSLCFRGDFALTTAPEDSTFYRYLNRILLVGAASALGGGAIRLGTDKLTDEVAKLREVLAVVGVRIENHEVRISNLETLYLEPMRAAVRPKPPSSAP